MYNIEQFERGNMLVIKAAPGGGTSKWKYLTDAHNKSGGLIKVLLNVDTAEIMGFDPDLHVITDYEVGDAK